MLPMIGAAIGLDLRNNLHCGFSDVTMNNFQALPAQVQSMVDTSEYGQSHTKSFRIADPLGMLNIALT